MTLMMDKASAVLQGAFLSANKLCLPSSLSSLQKADWSRTGRSVVEAVREICGQDELSAHPNTVAGCWKKRIVCVVWLKLLCGQAEEDVETAWRENPFFLLQNGLPEVSHVVLLELVKSLAAADIFAHFLLYLPQSQVCVELERLTQHVKSSPTGEDDVRLFLEVWWELWKGKNDQRAGGEEGVEAMFANQYYYCLG
ncbi:gem-associated protein 4 [Lates japonicus]|uniref:Gem-associated protein 4 n=1 Tax=Lates japonicus TaxID=270547 RepID=A0AAD3NIG5_LATJO|nr:gem-associated protein 4 [Lates japonicus]